MRDAMEDEPEADDSAKPIRGRRRRAPLPRWKRIASGWVGALCVLYALGAIAIWLMFRFVGESWWPATFLLFSPRWIWAVPLPVVLPLAGIFRRKSIWVPILTGVLVLIGLMGFSIPWRAAISPSRGPNAVRMVTANLHDHQADPRIVNDFLIQTKPDVVTFQVFDARTDIPYLHQPGWQMEVNDGIMIASRWPITLIDKSSMGQAPETADEIKGGMVIDGAAGRYLVHAPFGDFQVVSLHLTSPHKALSMMKQNGELAAHLLAANSNRRADSSALLASHVRTMPGPVLLGGDFNTTEDSLIFRSAWSAYNDAFSVAGFGFGTSYAMHRTWLRIDHILYDPSWQCHSSYTSGDIGSGHRAVFAELSR
jgi:endonuclease/exonuclease/phosphatase (EEP) superfamily protein YafD